MKVGSIAATEQDVVSIKSWGDNVGTLNGSGNGLKFDAEVWCVCAHPAPQLKV